MILKSSEMKTLVYDLVTFEDGVTAEGKRVIRQVFPKDHLRGAREIQDKIKANIQCLVGTEWKPLPEVTRSDYVTSEKHSDANIELTPSAENSLKYFYKIRQEIPSISVEALDAIEALAENKS